MGRGSRSRHVGGCQNPKRGWRDGRVVLRRGHGVASVGRGPAGPAGNGRKRQKAPDSQACGGAFAVQQKAERGREDGGGDAGSGARHCTRMPTIERHRETDRLFDPSVMLGVALASAPKRAIVRMVRREPCCWF
ncbi:hypothetical protein ANO11243_058450 [Dothideomycetidae sp. 11243]|nr:hypothetical protein ANO11243_058450 [fungal sp. No.11243]